MGAYVYVCVWAHVRVSMCESVGVCGFVYGCVDVYMCGRTCVWMRVWCVCVWVHVWARVWVCICVCVGACVCG